MSLVVPDRVGDQEYTLGLLVRYRAELRRLAATGARLLVPLQRGALTPKKFYEQACELVGLPLCPAFPMKKAGMPQEQIFQLWKRSGPPTSTCLGWGISAPPQSGSFAGF